MYWEIKKPQYRHRKHGERNKNGDWSAKQNRLGPLTLEARRWMLEQVLRIQDEVNRGAVGQPELSLINADWSWLELRNSSPPAPTPKSGTAASRWATSGYPNIWQTAAFSRYYFEEF